MKQFLFAIFILIIGLSLTNSIYAQEKEKAEKKDSAAEVQKEITNASTQQVEEGKPFNSVCPVSGEEIDRSKTFTYNGKTYAFCCNKCLKKFKADPEKYTGRLSEDGKSIVKVKKEEHQ